ncbi:hypothetical protein HXW87_19465 [Pseudomonas sp. Y5-11]|jgi:hypothetical protein|uniref:hypothetical protein n=1 Tax=Pseudomonas sp. Y5-11 TaxID=2749808 RepID=UPI001EFB0F29|nr:hypothetical protein [Pseudomonas sp. Y5-11]ULN84268.1 hypothetical protein HXW87_19465 [Pseudomonas sp. Y5-11]
MLKYNAAMANALLSLRLPEHSSVELSSIIEKGFFKKDGCELLDYFKESSVGVGLNHFEDQTGYECFVNSIHIDDYVESNWLGNALQFASELLDRWSANLHPEVLQVIVSSDEFGAMVKAHVVRMHEFWLRDNLDEYEDPVLMATSDNRQLNELLSQLGIK